MIEKVKWLDPALAAKVHNVVIGRNASQRPLATWVYKKMYDVRNDYLHGNDVAGPSLMLKDQKPVIDFAACLYGLALTGFIGLEFSEPIPPSDNAEAMDRFSWRRRAFHEPQRSLEAAILTAI